MLYEFHSKQNAKKPSSVHATYLLTGRKRAPEDTNGVNGRDGADLIMQSSPFMSMQTQETETPDEAAMPKTSIVLVREEELESTKSDFEKITSIHVYSLEPGPIESLNLLSVCNHEVASEHSGDDPMERWRLYGSIQNPYVKVCSPLGYSETRIDLYSDGLENRLLRLPLRRRLPPNLRPKPKRNLLPLQLPM